MSTVRRYDTLEDMRADDAPLVGSKYRIAGLNHVARNIAAWRESKGFSSPRSFEETDQVIVKLALVMTEVAEAIEAARTGDFENFQEELADAIIRILDVGGTMRLDLETAIEKKMRTNEGRPHMHGKLA